MKNNKHKNGLGLPEDYFENFEERLFSKISEDIIPKETGFSVPENYFNTLENMVTSHVSTPIKEIKIVSLITKKTFLYAASVAAVAIIAFSIFNNKNSTLTINDFDLASIERYVENENLDYDSYDLSSLLTDDDFEELTSKNEFISEEQLEEYLIEYINDTSIFTE